MVMQRRRLVGPDPAVRQQAGLGAAARIPSTSEHARQRRRSRRAQELVEAVSQLDAATDPATLRDLAAWVDSRYRESDCGQLVGLFARCYLGPPFVDHQLDLTASLITEHYRPEDTVPPAFATCRSLAQSAAYDYIEIYSDGQIVPIRPDGSPAI